MSTSILQILTELTALSPTGITVLKPFRSWYGVPQWRSRKVGMRLLNAGEMESAMEFVNSNGAGSVEQAFKKEIVARSLWSVDDAYVAPVEQVEEYNAKHKSELSDLEYKRVYVAQFEQYFADYLYSLYLELQQKQTRKVFGFQQCAICKTTAKTVIDGSRSILFNTAEIVCLNCLSLVVSDDLFEFEDGLPIASEVENTTSAATAIVDPTGKPTEIKTQSDFPTLDAYRDYLVDMGETNDITPSKI